MINNSEYIYGSAGFETLKGIRKSKGISRKEGVYVGTDMKNDPMFLTGDQHVYNVGGSGSGKTTCLILPITCGLGGQESIVCLDVKGSIAATTLPRLHERGIKGFAWNSYRLHCDAPWFLPHHAMNPGCLIDTNSLYFIPDVAVLMDAAIKTPTNTRDVYFYDKAKIWAKIFFIFLKTKLPDASFVDFYDLLNMVVGDFERFKRLAMSSFFSHPITEVATVAKEIIDMKKNSPKEYTGILSTLTKSFDWLNDPAIRQSMGKNDFHPSALLKGKTHFYIILPAEYIHKYASVIRLILASIMIYKQRHESESSILYLADEAGQLGYFQELERGFSYGREFGNQIFASFQNNAQAEHYTGGASGLMASAGARIFMGVRDYETAQTCSAMLGDQTLKFNNERMQESAAVSAREHNVSLLHPDFDPFTNGMKTQLARRNAVRKDKIKRALMTPDEVMQTDYMIVFTSETGCRPILAKKVPYYLMPELAGRYMPSPYRKPFDRIKIKTRWLNTTKKIVVHAVPPDSELAEMPQFQSGYYTTLI